MPVKKHTVLTLSEMEGVFEKAGKQNLLTLPRTADVIESIINTIDESCDDTQHEFHSLVDSEEGLCVVLKSKQ